MLQLGFKSSVRQSYGFLRDFGLRIPPSPYCSFLTNAIVIGAYFASPFAAFTIPFALIVGHENISGLVVDLAIMGAMFGITISLVFSIGRRRWDLTPWSQIPIKDV